MSNNFLTQQWNQRGLTINNGIIPEEYSCHIIHPEINSFFNNLTINLNELNDTFPLDEFDFYDPEDDANNEGLYQYAIAVFTRWIKEGKNNKITISGFERKDLVYTPYDCYHETSWRFRHHRLRKLRGEQQYLDNSFFYLHQDDLKINPIEHKPYYRYIDSPTGKFFDLDEGEWVYISIPFNGNGELNDKTEGILNQADLLNIPVIIDCSLLPLAKGFNINLNRPCIKELIFPIGNSIGMQKSRVCLRISNYSDKENVGADGATAGVPPIQLLNNEANSFVSPTELLLATKVLKTFSIDYMHNACKKHQLTICQELELIPTSCVNICMIPDDSLWWADKKMKKLYDKEKYASNDLYPRVDISHAITQKLKEEYHE